MRKQQPAGPRPVARTATEEAVARASYELDGIVVRTMALGSIETYHKVDAHVDSHAEWTGLIVAAVGHVHTTAYDELIEVEMVDILGIRPAVNAINRRTMGEYEPATRLHPDARAILYEAVTKTIQDIMLHKAALISTYVAAARLQGHPVDWNEMSMMIGDGPPPEGGTDTEEFAELMNAWNTPHCVPDHTEVAAYVQSIIDMAPEIAANK